MSELAMPVHAPMDLFPVQDDCLLAGGLPVTRVADCIGSTPFYVYDRRIIDERVRAVRSVLPGGVKLHYAIKANPMPALLAHMAGKVDGLDVASGRELLAALSSGASPGEISFAGPGKSVGELEQAVAAGILLNVESLRELHAVAEISKRTGRAPRVALRVNPEFELKNSGMRMGGGAKQFGIDVAEVPAALRAVRELRLPFEGFHIYSGSQNLRAESICEAQWLAVELAIRLAADAPGPLRTVNIGGGFGIPYFPGEKHLDLNAVGAGLARCARRLAEAMPQAHLVIELGRYLVGEAGLYICRVIDRKVSRGQVFLVTDGGLHHHLAASGNFGQVLRKNYPVVIANRVRGGPREIASVVGPLCTPLDLLADRMELAEAHPGDLVAVYQSGAYGLTASPRDFLSHPHPAEILL